MRNTTLLCSAAAIGALLLGGCNKPATAPQNTLANAADMNNVVADNSLAGNVQAPAGALPLLASAPAGPMPTAPAASALPPAPPAPVAADRDPHQRYRYVEDARAMSGAFADSPPDYAVQYGGARPWIWRSGNGSYRVVEVVPGGMRYYYYRSGETEPFFVQDPRYAYAYNGGRLAVVYDAYGRPLAPGSEAGEAELAGRYLARARALYYAAAHDRREAAYEANWQAQRNLLFQQQQQWEIQRQRDADWRAWHDQQAAQQQNQWGAEQARRQAWAAQVQAARSTRAMQGVQAARAADQARQAAAVAAMRQNQAAAQAGQAQAQAQRAAQQQAQSQAAARQAAQQQALAARQGRVQAQVQARQAAQQQAQTQAAARGAARQQALAARQARVQAQVQTRQSAQQQALATRQAQAQRQAAQQQALAARQAQAKAKAKAKADQAAAKVARLKAPQARIDKAKADRQAKIDAAKHPAAAHNQVTP